MIIVDASVLANALTDDGPLGSVSRAELAADAHWAGPESLLVEAFSEIRGRLLGGKIGEQRARDAVQALSTLAIELLSTSALLPRMWQLRANVSGYEAAYVAAAEAYRCALVTSDGRLARASGIRCAVRLATPTG